MSRIVHSQVQAIPSNAWTHVPGTDLQIHVSAPDDALLEVEMMTSDKGEQYVEVRACLNTEGTVSVRTPW
jgi:hypothetical protein